MLDKFGDLKPLSASEIETFGCSVDSIITYDPETFEERVTAEVNCFNSENIASIQLIQDWIWDDRRNKLLIRPVGCAPILRRYDDYRNFLNEGRIFWKAAK